MANLFKVFALWLAVVWIGGEPACGQAVNSFRLKKVVIDPGHGGKDPGAVYAGVREKDITLGVGLKLAALIRRHYPDVEVLMTRKTDVFIPLNERSDVANKAGADLFISVHVNSAPSKGAAGTETFVMGINRSQDNLDLAMRENSVITYEEDYQTKYEGYDPNSAESFIIFSLMQYSYLEQSLSFADLIQRQYRSAGRVPDRGVKQMGLIVLWRATMPSVLTEIGFITNEAERRRMVSAAGQEEIARTLFNAFSQYKALTEKSASVVLDPRPEAVPEAAAVPAAAEKKPARDIRFRIQIRSSGRPLDPASSKDFSVYRGQAEEKKIGGLYKYYLYDAETYEEVLSLLPKVKRRFPDAFIAAFDGGRPIPVREAKELSGKKNR